MDPHPTAKTFSNQIGVTLEIVSYPLTGEKN
jgi:hypothetical protein